MSKKDKSNQKQKKGALKEDKVLGAREEGKFTKENEKKR